jgi:pimeloyl-ACP methyl ester carboxylesterase
MRMKRRLIRLPQTGGPALGLWESRALRERRPPVLLVHGATYGAAIFDLDRSGYSLMAELAAGGRAVYALEVRGYGASADTAVMNAPAVQNPPYARAEEVISDVAAATAFICQESGAQAIDLIGFSWGTIVAALFAERFAREVRRLALYAPLYGTRNDLWLERIGDPQDRTMLAPRYGSYREITLQDTFQRWNDDLPNGDTAEFREAGIAELLFETQAALDPHADAASPRAFRCPNGALADLIRVFNGEPLYEPAKLAMPLLLVRGEHDTTSTPADIEKLRARLPRSGARYCEIPGGSHFLCIERNRHKLYEELRGFLQS